MKAFTCDVVFSVGDPGQCGEMPIECPVGGETIIMGSVECMHEPVRRAIEAAGAEEALDVMETRADGVELVLTDVVMPRKGGRELADELRRRWPGLPVIFMSGYADQAMANYAHDTRRGALVCAWAAEFI